MNRDQANSAQQPVEIRRAHLMGVAVLANKACVHVGRTHTRHNGIVLCGKPAACILASGPGYCRDC